MIKQLLVFFTIAVLIPQTGKAQYALTARLDSLFTRLDTNRQAMGSIALTEKGELLYNRAIGYSLYTAERKIPANNQTKYRIGSISKIFTAVIIFQLIEENKLSLLSLLSDYFPEFPKAEKITIAQLLNHHSPLRNITAIEEKEKPRTQQQMLTQVALRMNNFKPGSKASYSNANYLLLGYIIEKICGVSFGQVLEERIVSPLGLAGTYLGQCHPADDNESFPYQLNQDWEQQPETDPSIPGASGALISTPADLVKFMQALFTQRLLSHSSLEQMTTINDGYGMGLLEFEFNKKKALGYTGGIDGFESVAAYFPADSLAIAYCSNANVYAVRSIVLGSLHIYYNDLYKIPDFKRLPAINRHLQQYTGVYASTEIPLRIIIKKQRKMLVAEAIGQGAFILEAITASRFRCEEAAVVMEFIPEKRAMKLKRDGRSYLFRKEE